MPNHRSIGIIALLAVFSLPALAGLANPVPFQATYYLSVDGWPDARIDHRLSRQGELWQSEMRAAISIAEGEERSRFRLDGRDIDAESYISGYELLGIGKQYRLSEDDLTLPDRQTALFALSRQAPNASCTHDQVAPCKLSYLDHKGDEEKLHYRVIERSEARLSSGTFPGITVDTWDPEKPERRLVFTFHRDVPGLLLVMEYHRDGERKSRLTLTQLTFPNGVAPGKTKSHQQN